MKQFWRFWICPSTIICWYPFMWDNMATSNRQYWQISPPEQEHILLYTYWDLHTEKPQSKFSYANRCKPIKCCVSLFPHVRKAIRPIRSRVSCTASWSFHSRLVGAVSSVHCTSHRFASLKRANSFNSHFFHRLILKVPVSTKAMSEKRFVIHDSSVEEYAKSLEVSFGFYFSSFAFYEAAFFQCWKQGFHQCFQTEEQKVFRQAKLFELCKKNFPLHR